MLNARWSDGTHHNSTAFEGAVVMNKKSSPTASRTIIKEKDFMKKAKKRTGEPMHMLKNKINMVLPLFDSDSPTCTDASRLMRRSRMRPPIAVPTRPVPAVTPPNAKSAVSRDTSGNSFVTMVGPQYANDPRVNVNEA